MWVAGVDRAKPGYVVLVAAKDTEKAQEAIDKSAKSEKKPVKERSYKGVDYQVDSDGVAAGIVGDFLTVGTEPEFKRTVAAEDGDSLADEKRFKSAIDDLDDDRIGSFYVDLKPFIEQAVKSDPKAARPARADPLDLPHRQARADERRAARGRGPDRVRHDHAAARASSRSARSARSSGTGTTPLIAELPGDSWAAYGAPNVGPGLKSLFTRVAGAFGGAAATQQLQQQYGIDLERDVFGWIGDIGAVRARERQGVARGRPGDQGDERGEHAQRVRQDRRADPEPGRQEGLAGEGQGRGGGVLARPDRRARQAGHPRPLRRPRGRSASARRRRPTRWRRPRSSGTRSCTGRRRSCSTTSSPRCCSRCPTS